MLILKRLIWIITLTFLCGVVANAQSQRPTPGRGEKNKPPQIHSPNSQQKSEPDKRGTEQSPLIVKTINPPKTKTEAEQERKDHEEKSAHDYLLVRYTGILAGVAILQFLALAIQAYYLNRGFQATKLAADAATDGVTVQKTAMISTLRAFLFVDHFDFHSALDPVSKLPQQLKIRARFMNSGSTPAMNATVISHAQSFNNPTPDEEIIPDMSQEIKSNKIFIGPHVSKFSKDIIIEREEMIDIFSNTKRYFIWVFMEYNDFHLTTDLHHINSCAEVVILHDPSKPVNGEGAEMARCQAFGDFDYAD